MCVVAQIDVLSAWGFWVVLLSMLELSAAFGTFNDRILLMRLHGIRDEAHNTLTSKEEGSQLQEGGKHKKDIYIYIPSYIY